MTSILMGRSAAPTDRLTNLQQAVEELGESVFAHTAARVDAEGRYPRENIKALRDAGLLLLPVPVRYGGFAHDGSDTSDAFWCNRIFRTIARTCSSTSQVFFVHCMAVRMLLRAGSPAQRGFVADAVKKGHTFAAASAEGGKTIYDRRTAARRVEGGYLLNGTKTFCTGHGEARYVLVARVPDPAPAGGNERPAEVLFDCLVEMDQPGVRRHDDWDNLGQRGTTSGSITFEDVFVADEMVFPNATRSLYVGLILQAAFSSIFVGIGEGALQAGARYVRTTTRPYPAARVDQAVDDPNIQWHIGDMATQLHVAGLAVDHASHAMTSAEQEREGYSRADASIAVQMAKIAATTAALDVTQRIFEVMGARSTASRHALDIYWRNARTLTLHDPVDQKYRVVGRRLLTGEEPPVTSHT